MIYLAPMRPKHWDPAYAKRPANDAATCGSTYADFINTSSVPRSSSNRLVVLETTTVPADDAARPRDTPNRSNTGAKGFSMDAGFHRHPNNSITSSTTSSNVTIPAETKMIVDVADVKNSD